MSKSITSTLLVLSVILVAACTSRTSNDAAAPQEFVIVEPEPISAEPVYTGKYK